MLHLERERRARVAVRAVRRRRGDDGGGHAAESPRKPRSGGRVESGCGRAGQPPPRRRRRRSARLSSPAASHPRVSYPAAARVHPAPMLSPVCAAALRSSSSQPASPSSSPTTSSSIQQRSGRVCSARTSLRAFLEPFAPRQPSSTASSCATAASAKVCWLVLVAPLSVVLFGTLRSHQP